MKFKVGDEVIWEGNLGVVIPQDKNKNPAYPVHVEFKEDSFTFTEDGVFDKKESPPRILRKVTKLDKALA
jgi:hypothetical protein